MRNRLLLTVLVTGTVALALFFGNSMFEESALTEREAFEKYLAEHPYANRAPMTREDLKALPKADRPDLALEQQFLLTMDPATRSIPIERLWEANRIASAIKRGGGGPLATTSWEDRGPANVGGRTRALMFDPNDAESKKMWAGGVGGGLWYTDDITDTNADWQPVDDFWANLAVSAIAYDPTNTNVFYVGTGEGWFNFDAIRGAGIFKTENGGETWEHLAATQNPTFYNIQDILVEPSSGDVYVSTREGGLQRSQDGGETFSSVLTSSVNQNRAADLEIGADGRIYVSFGVFSLGDIYASDTGDADTWEEISGDDGDDRGFPTTGIRRIELATAPSDEDVLYAVTSLTSNAVGGVYRSNDKGASWTQLSFPGHPGDNFRPPGAEPSNGQSWYDLILTVHPENPDIVYLGTIDVQRSSNGGQTWELITSAYGSPGVQNVHPDQHNIVFRPGFPNEAVFSHDGGITYTPDATLSASAITLLNRNLGYNVTQYYAGALNPDAGSNTMLAGAQDNGTQRYFQPGFGFTSTALGGDGAYTHIDQDEPNFAIASSQFGNYRRSTNGGISFGSLLNAGGSFIAPSDYDSRENILYAQRNSSSFWRVRNITGSPQSSPVNIALLSGATHFSVSPYAPEGTSTVYIGTVSGRVFKVEGAESDEPVITQLSSVPSPGGAVSSIEIGRSENELLLTVSNYGRVSVYESLDGGLTWVDKEGNLPDMPVRWALYHPTAPGVAILATEAGVWETTDLGSPEPTWTPSATFPTVSTYMLQWRESDNQVMASTHGRGVFTAFWSDNVVANEGDQASPEAAGLSAAYPNPFVDRTQFSLTVSEAQDIRVEVYDVRGRRVAMLHEGPLAAQEHRFEIEGSDLAAGTYLYVATGERFREEGRVTLVR